MGKSPGKWLRTMLLGRKSSRRPPSPKRATCNWKEIPTLLVDALSQPESPSPALTAGAIENVDLEPESPSCLLVSKEASLPEIGTAGREEPTSELSPVSEDPEIENAVVKLQAACRGYLACRAFSALKGIVRLQAVVRGYLVRRQAVVTLYCTLGIVQLQMLARGRKSPLPKEMHILLKHKFVAKSHYSSLNSNKKSKKRRFPAQAFIYKLLSTTPIAMPMKIQKFEEGNSAWNWLERWSSSHVWEPLSGPMKPSVLKSHVHHSSRTVENQSRRSIGSVRRQFPSRAGSPSTSTFSDSDKKHNPTKLTGLSVSEDQEKPQRKMIQDNQNIRKVSALAPRATGQADQKFKQPMHSVKRLSKPEEVELKDEANKLSEDFKVLTGEDNGGSADGSKCKLDVNAMHHIEETSPDVIALTTEYKAASLGNASKYEPDILVIEHVEEVGNYVNLSVTADNANSENGSECGPYTEVRDTAQEALNYSSAIGAHAISRNCSKSLPDTVLSMTQNRPGGIVGSPQRVCPLNQSSRSKILTAEFEKKKLLNNVTSSSIRGAQKSPQNKPSTDKKKLLNVSNTRTQTISQAARETEHPKHSVRKLSGSTRNIEVIHIIKETEKDVVLATKSHSVLQDSSICEPHLKDTDSCENTENNAISVSNVNDSLGSEIQREPGARFEDSGGAKRQDGNIIATVSNAISVNDSEYDPGISSSPLCSSKQFQVDESPDCHNLEVGTPPLQGLVLHEKASSKAQTCRASQKPNTTRESQVSKKPAGHDSSSLRKHPNYTPAAHSFQERKLHEPDSKHPSIHRYGNDGLTGNRPLPSTNSGKPTLHQTQRPVRKNATGGLKAEKPVQAEWKR